MNANVESVVDDLRSLPADKFVVAAQVIHALRIESDHEIHPAWQAELDRRGEDVANDQSLLSEAEMSENIARLRNGA
ncbi:MAG: hypothetical protein ACQKBV_01535 [Puniceicoccales bacterium]